jgi:acetoin utilization deacetylase AcuC-like enzyme
VQVTGMMRVFWDDRQRLHAPSGEFFNGIVQDAAESCARVDAVLAARISAPGAPADHGLNPILRIHNAAYVEFLQTAHADWVAAGRVGDAFPYTFPLVGRRRKEWNRIDATIGHYSFDTSTPIGAGTWDAAYWSAQTALSAVDAVLSGDAASFGICRPPGHHAGSDYCGGYCYLNNAAIAAERAIEAGCKRVAILDVDYHHGNGTQDIFAGREDVFFASVHADPVTDYPFYWGHVDENSRNILNVPLPRGTDWVGYAPALSKAVSWVHEKVPELLIVSFGADTHEADPISHFKLKTDDYRRMAGRIASLGVPTVVLLEGGYAVEALGENVAAFLSDF